MTSKSYTGKVPVRAKTHTAVECKAEAKLEVPYRIHLESGRTSSGVWHGVSTWGFHVTIDERRNRLYVTDWLVRLTVLYY